jgi:hypothetical protein
MYIQYIYICVCVCVRERVRESDISQVFHSLISVWPIECTGEYSATARRAAVTRVRSGAFLNCKFQIGQFFHTLAPRIDS